MYWRLSTSKGMRVSEHGSFNKMVISFMIVGDLLIYYVVKFIVHLVLKFKSLLILFLFFGGWYAIRVHNSCEGWELGIGNSKILNDVGEARIENPNY